MDFIFGNTFGLLGLLALIPLIILYLIKPRPIKFAVPSLIFFSRRTRFRRTYSILRYIVKDLLFFLQLLILIFLALSLADPYLVQEKDIASGNVVFVLDASASSQVIEEGGKTRFEIAEDKIMELAGGKNNLVLAKSFALVALQDVGKAELRTFLGRLQAGDDESAVGEAILLAGEIVEKSGEKGRVVVLSDFISTKGIDPGTARSALMSKGIGVDFIDSVKGGEKKNIGIVEMVVNEELTSIYIKNFNVDNERVKVLVDGEENLVNIKKGSMEPFVFKSRSGVSEIKLDVNDDFAADNKVFVSIPINKKVNVLLIESKSRKSRFLKAGLEALEYVEVVSGEPPVLPSGDFDIYIIGGLDKDALLPGTFMDLIKEVENEGAGLVIAAQEDSANINFEGALGFDIKGISKSGGEIIVDQINKFTKDIDFGDVKNYLITEESIVGIGSMKKIASVDDVPVLAMEKVGKGFVVYYGIIEESSDFKISPGYPVFWANLIKYISGRSDINELNIKTGTRFMLDNEELIIDKVGVYDIGEGKIVANLLSNAESNINRGKDGADREKGVLDFELGSIKEKVENHLALILLLIVIGLILFEVWYVKRRGEL